MRVPYEVDSEADPTAPLAPPPSYVFATHWRQGRKVGRTIYWQVGEEPSDSDPLIGVMDSPELAMIACKAVNEYFVRQAI